MSRIFTECSFCGDYFWWIEGVRLCDEYKALEVTIYETEN